MDFRVHSHDRMPIQSVAYDFVRIIKFHARLETVEVVFARGLRVSIEVIIAQGNRSVLPGYSS